MSLGMSYEMYEAIQDYDLPEPDEDPYKDLEPWEMDEGPECEWAGYDIVSGPVRAPGLPRLRKHSRIQLKETVAA